jgi:hypothetical protein
MVALKLLANLIEHHRGERKQSQMRCSQRGNSPVFVQRVRRSEELERTHLEGLTCLVRAEDWILGCLHERLRQIRVHFYWSTPARAA